MIENIVNFYKFFLSITIPLLLFFLQIKLKKISDRKKSICEEVATNSDITYYTGRPQEKFSFKECENLLENILKKYSSEGGIRRIKELIKEIDILKQQEKDELKIFMITLLLLVASGIFVFLFPQHFLITSILLMILGFGSFIIFIIKSLQ